MGITVSKTVQVPDLATFRSSDVYPGYGAYVVWLQGTTTPNDGGQSFYQVSLTDKSTADNGTTCIVDLGGFRWFQVTTPEPPSGIVPVTSGGTGVATLAAHGVLVGNGTSAVTVTAAGTATTLLHGNASGDPTWGAVALATDVSGTLPAANGGTGIASYTIGDLLYASASTTLAKLADVAVGSVLASGGVGVAPAWTSLAQLSPALVTPATTYPILTTDYYVICITTAFTTTLPTAASLAGRSYVIKNGNTVASGNVITVATTSAQTIDGSATATLNPLQSITVVSDGANWRIV